MDIKKGMEMGVAGVTGVVGLFILLCLGLFLAIFAAFFWIFLFALIGLGSYSLIPGIILGIVTSIGILRAWINNQ